MRLALQTVDKPRRPKGTLKRIVRKAFGFPVDEMLPKSKLQAWKKLLAAERRGRNG